VSRGVGLLVAYSAGLGLPFLLSAIALGSFLKFFKRYRPFIPTVERAAGVLLVVVGVLVYHQQVHLVERVGDLADSRVAAEAAVTAVA